MQLLVFSIYIFSKESLSLTDVIYYTSDAQDLRLNPSNNENKIVVTCNIKGVSYIYIRDLDKSSQTMIHQTSSKIGVVSLSAENDIIALDLYEDKSILLLIQGMVILYIIIM